MKRVVTVVGMVGLLGACANSPEQSPWLMSRGAATPMSCAPLSQDQELALNLAQKSADEGRVHAALANLERLPSGLPQANLYKARILRSLNRPEARELYTSLLGTCLKAQGEHGLGQLASAQGNYAEALDHLRLAATLDPTSDTIRNDLGVVYMNLGRMDEARFELLTALELNETEKQPALNLLTLLIYQGNLTQASALTERMGFSASEFRTAEQRAQTLRSKIGAGAGATAQPGAAKPAPRAQQSAPAGVAPAPKPVQTRPASAPQPVAQVAIAPKAVSPTPVAAPRPPAVPAPQLSNFRPAPVVPLAIATAARSPASAVAPVVVASAPAAAPTSVAPRQVAAAPVVVSQPAAVAVAAAATPVAAPIVVAAAPVPAIAPASVTSSAPTPVAPRQVAAAPVIVSQPTAPAVAAAPTPVVAPVVVAAAPVDAPAPVASRQVAAAPVVVSQPAVAVAPTPAVAPVVASQPAAPAPASRSVASTPTAALANQVRAQIEMRPGRLIVPDDGGFIRVEPVSDLQGNAVANQR